MPTTPYIPKEEVKPETPLPEGNFAFSSRPEERGEAAIKHQNGELSVAMGGRLRGAIHKVGKESVETQDGKSQDVLEISLSALSPGNTQGVSLLHLQLDGDTLANLFSNAQELGILPKLDSK